jgi:hypothetical protein
MANPRFNIVCARGCFADSGGFCSSNRNPEWTISESTGLCLLSCSANTDAVLDLYHIHGSSSDLNFSDCSSSSGAVVRVNTSGGQAVNCVQFVGCAGDSMDLIYSGANGSYWNFGNFVNNSCLTIIRAHGSITFSQCVFIDNDCSNANMMT